MGVSGKNESIICVTAINFCVSSAWLKELFDLAFLFWLRVLCECVLKVLFAFAVKGIFCVWCPGI